MFASDLDTGGGERGGEALRNYSAFWAAGWPQFAKRPPPNVSEHLSPSLPGEPTESARRPLNENGGSSMARAASRSLRSRPNQRTNLFRVNRGPAIARGFSRLFVSPSGRQI